MQTFRNGFDRVRVFLHHHPYFALFIVYLIILSWLSNLVIDFLWPMGLVATLGILMIIPIILCILAIRQRYLAYKRSNVVRLTKYQ